MEALTEDQQNTIDELAPKVAQFVVDNNIDLNKVPMKKIVDGYISSVSNMWDEIEKELEGLTHQEFMSLAKKYREQLA